MALTIQALVDGNVLHLQKVAYSKVERKRRSPSADGQGIVYRGDWQAERRITILCQGEISRYSGVYKLFNVYSTDPSKGTKLVPGRHLNGLILEQRLLV